MASVWLARFGGRAGFERLVVVKMILPQYSQDPRFQEMFLDEARIASRIEHANVARILDVGEHGTGHFIVLEWVDGDSLSKLMRAAEQQHDPIPTGVALRICADAAAGLHAAHVLQDRQGNALGVVHRDVSPQNILVANNGATKLIDFGIAKARDRVSQDTSAGQLKGKVRYMAPEQALGRAVDARADIWSLGTILYELFAGVPAYDGENEVATLHKLTSGAPPAPLPEKVPAVIRTIVEKALAYDLEKRFSNAMELHDALEAALTEIGQPTSTTAVAEYAGRLLAERQDLRRRTVDGALGEAHNRDAARAAAGPHGMTNPGVGMTNPGMAMPYPPMHPASGSLPLGHEGTGMLSTLGSAVVEYPMPSGATGTYAQGPKRTGLIALGLCVLAGLIGVMLIVAANQAKLNAERNAEKAALDEPDIATSNIANEAVAPVNPTSQLPASSTSETAAVTTTEQHDAGVADVAANAAAKTTATTGAPIVTTTEPHPAGSTHAPESAATGATKVTTATSTANTQTSTVAQTATDPSHANSTTRTKATTAPTGKKNRGF